MPIGTCGHEPRGFQMKTEGLRLAAYLRVSDMGEREEGSERFHSTTFQDEDVERWAERNGATISVRRQELNLSGAKWEARKGYQECVQMVEAGEVDGVIVAYLSRFARDMRVAYMALGRIADAGGMVISVSEGIDTRTRQGRTNFNLRMSMAQDEWESKREELMRVAQTKIRNGIPMRTCFGYCRGPHGRLVPDPVEAPWVPRVFDWRVAGIGWREIAFRLNEANAPAPSKKGKLWTPTTVRDVIGRRTYLGEVWHDAKRETVTVGAHEPLVDDLTFTRANRVQAGQRFERHRHHLLAGVLHCAGCRYKMKATTAMPRRGDGDRTEYVSYICRGSHGGGRCPDPARVTELQLEPLLRRQAIRMWNVSGKVFAQQRQDSTIQRLRDEADILQARYERHWRDEELRDLDRAGWMAIAVEMKADAEAKREELSLQLKALNAEQTEATRVPEWPATPEGQRVMLQSAFEMVFLRGASGALDSSRLHLIAKGSPTPDVPMPGKVFDSRPFLWTDDTPARTGELGGE